MRHLIRPTLQLFNTYLKLEDKILRLFGVILEAPYYLFINN